MSILRMLGWWREYTIVGLLVVIAGGYWLWPENVGPAPQVIHVKQESQTKQTVTEITTKPDGTKVEKTIKTEKDTKVSERSTDKSRYGVGVYIGAAGRNDYRLDASMRLGTSPLHGVVGYEFKDKTVYAGVRVEF